MIGKSLAYMGNNGFVGGTVFADQMVAINPVWANEIIARDIPAFEDVASCSGSSPGDRSRTSPSRVAPGSSGAAGSTRTAMPIWSIRRRRSTSSSAAAWEACTR